jgi:hypothetical protein
MCIALATRLVAVTEESLVFVQEILGHFSRHGDVHPAFDVIVQLSQVEIGGQAFNFGTGFDRNDVALRNGGYAFFVPIDDDVKCRFG